MASDKRVKEDLRATVDAIDADTGRLREVEALKRELDPGDPRADELSDRAVELANRVRRATVAERDLTDDLHDDPSPPRRPD